MPAKVYESLFGLLVPELCPRCRGTTKTGFCTGCRRDFIRNESYCSVCGLTPEPQFATICDSHDVAWCTDAVRAPYLYCDPVDRYLHALKFRGDRKLGRAFGQLLAADVAARALDIDALVAVPLHRSRLLERGYNQALEIARIVSFQLRLPLLLSGIVRRQPTPAQTGLGKSARRRNLRAAFAVTREFRNCRIAIVDDVITTGATVDSLAAALLAKGASRVEAWAVARTPRPAARMPTVRVHVQGLS